MSTQLLLFMALYTEIDLTFWNFGNLWNRETTLDSTILRARRDSRWKFLTCTMADYENVRRWWERYQRLVFSVTRRKICQYQILSRHGNKHQKFVKPCHTQQTTTEVCHVAILATRWNSYFVTIYRDTLFRVHNYSYVNTYITDILLLSN